MKQLEFALGTTEEELDEYATEKAIPSHNRVADNLGLWAVNQRDGVVEWYKNEKRFIRSDEFAAAAISMLGSGLVDKDEMRELFHSRSTNKLTLVYRHLGVLYEAPEGDFDEKYYPIIEQSRNMIEEELENRGYKGELEEG